MGAEATEETTATEVATVVVVVVARATATTAAEVATVATAVVSIEKKWTKGEVLPLHDSLAEFASIPFVDRVDETNRWTHNRLETLQINIGKKCNLSCTHCHVQAGPERAELMSREVMQACLDLIDTYGFTTLDITGGSPEMNPHLEWLLDQATQRTITVIVRSNLVILSLPEYAHFAELYAKTRVRLIVSLPCYGQENTDTQRGSGTFGKNINILQKLNELGYGMGSGLMLDIMYNPVGVFLPSSQDQLEHAYKTHLRTQFGIEFDRLFVMTNNPLGRFAQALLAEGTLQAYIGTLVDAFNPATLPTMMCRSQLSVDYEGVCFDCDFNQAAAQPCLDGRTIFDYRNSKLENRLNLKRTINFGTHCYACCAGSGSSCGGVTALSGK